MTQPDPTGYERCPKCRHMVSNEVRTQHIARCMPQPDMLQFAAREADIEALILDLDGLANPDNHYVQTMRNHSDVYARAALAEALALFIETPEGSDEFDAVDSTQ